MYLMSSFMYIYHFSLAQWIILDQKGAKNIGNFLSSLNEQILMIFLKFPQCLFWHTLQLQFENSFKLVKNMIPNF